jgi:hypothetical protein
MSPLVKTPIDQSIIFTRNALIYMRMYKHEMDGENTIYFDLTHLNIFRFHLD